MTRKPRTKSAHFKWVQPRHTCAVRLPQDLYDRVTQLAVEADDSINRVLVSLVRQSLKAAEDRDGK